MGHDEGGDHDLHVGDLWGFDSGVDKSEDRINGLRRIRNVDNGNLGWFGVVLFRWLGDGEHVFENRGSEGEDEFVNAEFAC